MSASTTPRRLGTLEGVFVPTSMTILGVILFVRTGWVVGQVGLIGALAVILGSFAVSTATALSLASIVTNVRVEAGGAFALLARTLGIEPGGSIGLPLYLAQALAIPLYVFGFREGWLQVFPDHPAWLVDGLMFLAVFAIAGASARFAFRLQFVVLAILAAAVASLVGGVATEPVQDPTLWVSDGDGLLVAFAVFFPAVTGIMAGVNMSGELADPPRSIASGTLSAIGVTLAVYVAVAVSAALLVDPIALRSEDTALADYAAWRPLVVLGLLSATFSSALSTAVGAPRILQALGASHVVPGGAWLAEPGWRGEPHRAMVITALVAGGGIALRELNSIAPLITLFFLLTYAAINGTLLLQQGLELPRFRPSFRVPLAVPLLGLLGCLAGMLAVSPMFTALALAATAGTYAVLAHRSPEGPYGQVRAGAVLAAMTWGVGRLGDLPTNQAWQAHALVPVRHSEPACGLVPLLATLARRGGSVAVLDVGEGEPGAAVEEALRERDTVVRHGRVPDGDMPEVVRLAAGVLSATLVPPNLVVLPFADLDHPWAHTDALADLVEAARDAGLGLWLASPQRDESDAWPRVEVWIEGRALELEMSAEGLPLVFLAAWRVRHAHGLAARATVVLDPGVDEDRASQARSALSTLASKARIPGLQTRLVEDRLRDAVCGSDEALHFLVLRDPAHARDQLEAIAASIRGQLVVACLSGRLDHEDEDTETGTSDGDNDA